MTLKSYRFAGLDADVWLPDDIDVRIDIVPDRLIGWVRSGVTFAGQTKTTWHDTGNPHSTAIGERNYLHSGPRTGNGGKRQAGYNFAFDDTRIIQLTPLDEVTWAAGTATGNRLGYHVEHAFGGSTDWARSLEVGAALHGGLIAARGWDISALVQHNHWSGKHCPGQIRNRGIWPTVVNSVAAAAQAARAAALNIEEPPAEGAWPYPDPVKPAFWDALQSAPYALDGETIWYRVNTLYRVKSETPRQQFALADERVVGPVLEPGTTFRAEAVGESVSDRKPWVVTPQLTRVALDNLEFVDEDETAEAA